MQQQKDTVKKDSWAYKVLNVLSSGDKTSTVVFEELQRSGDIPQGAKSELSSEWNNVRYTLSKLDKINKVVRVGEKRGSEYSITEKGLEAIRGEE